jgi:GTPase SAR1 family protein
MNVALIIITILLAVLGLAAAIWSIIDDSRHIKKHLCILGPKYSGKTVFIYLFLHKLVWHKYLIKGMLHNFNDATIDNLDKEVEDRIEKGKWPDPSQKLSNEIRLAFKKSNFFKYDKRIDIPDVSGEIFEDLTEKITNDQSKSINTIKDADAYILLVDSSELKEKRNFYEKFLTTFTEKINNGNLCNKPLLVLLNKSDLIRKDKELYGDSSKAIEYIKNNADLFYAKIGDSFEPDKIDYAWHSSITNTLPPVSDGKKRRPDYARYRKYDPIEYIESIIKFLGKI